MQPPLARSAMRTVITLQVRNRLLRLSIVLSLPSAPRLRCSSCQAADSARQLAKHVSLLHSHAARNACCDQLTKCRRLSGGGFSEPVTPRDEGGWLKGQFEHKCLSIMQSCWTEFGEFIIYFNEPVNLLES